MTEKEKFKEAKRLYQTANADQRYVLETLFPELNESEDERIRKELIAYIKDQQSSFISPPDCRDKYEEEENDKYNSWIVWLEKQSEQNSAWSEEDKNAIQVLKDIVRHSDEINEKIYIMPLKEKLYDWLKSLRPQKQWKPSDDQIKALAWALSLAKNCGEECAFDLRTLYEQLKKLKGE